MLQKIVQSVLWQVVEVCKYQYSGEVRATTCKISLKIKSIRIRAEGGETSEVCGYRSMCSVPV